MKRRNWFWGLFFIGCAILLLLGNRNIFFGLSTTTLMLTVLLLAAFAHSLSQRSVWGSVFSLAFLASLYLDKLGITGLSPFSLMGAAALLSIGISFLYHPDKTRCCHSHHSYADDSFKDVESVHDDQMVFTTTFGSSIKYVKSDDFRQACITCKFGGMKIYLDQATIQNGDALIQVDASFSGIELYIPKSWYVINKVNTTFGGVEEKMKNSSTGVPAVTLIGNVSFSGITIYYV